MSTTSNDTTSETEQNEVSNVDRVKAWLEEQTADGPVRFKSRHVVDEIPLSVKQIGHATKRIQDNGDDNDYQIRKVANQGTWEVAQAEDAYWVEDGDGR